MPFLQTLDGANPTASAERSCPKTAVIYYSTDEELETNSSHWQLHVVRTLATVNIVEDGTVTLGIARGSEVFVASQLSQKAMVVRAMHERIQLCADP